MIKFITFISFSLISISTFALNEIQKMEISKYLEKNINNAITNYIGSKDKFSSSIIIDSNIDYSNENSEDLAFNSGYLPTPLAFSKNIEKDILTYKVNIILMPDANEKISKEDIKKIINNHLPKEKTQLKISEIAKTPTIINREPSSVEPETPHSTFTESFLKNIEKNSFKLIPLFIFTLAFIAFLLTLNKSSNSFASTLKETGESLSLSLKEIRPKTSKAQEPPQNAVHIDENEFSEAILIIKETLISQGHIIEKLLLENDRDCQIFFSNIQYYKDHLEVIKKIYNKNFNGTLEHDSYSESKFGKSDLIYFSKKILQAKLETDNTVLDFLAEDNKKKIQVIPDQQYIINFDKIKDDIQVLLLTVNLLEGETLVKFSENFNKSLWSAIIENKIDMNMIDETARKLLAIIPSHTSAQENHHDVARTIEKLVTASNLDYTEKIMKNLEEINPDNIKELKNLIWTSDKIFEIPKDYLKEYYTKLTMSQKVMLINGFTQIESSFFEDLIDSPKAKIILQEEIKRSKSKDDSRYKLESELFSKQTIQDLQKRFKSGEFKLTERSSGHELKTAA